MSPVSTWGDKIMISIEMSRDDMRSLMARLSRDAVLSCAYDGVALHYPESLDEEVQAAMAADPLPDLKAELKAMIDAAAETERGRYITAGAGQAMTYQQKANEAVMLEDDPAPDPAAYPLLSAEVGITAPTLAEVGAAVRLAHGQWIVLGAAIEGIRLGAKRAIDLAWTAEAAEAAAAVTWPSAPG